MRTISKVAIHNVYTEGKTAVIDFPTPVTILTGYNGIGKSTTLAVIHSTLSIYGKREFLFPRTNWASQIHFDSGLIVNHAKIGRVLESTYGTSLAGKNNNTTESLKDFYQRIFSAVTNIVKNRNILISKEGERRDSRSTNFMALAQSPKKRGREDSHLSDQDGEVQSILYCDELFNFSLISDEIENLDDLDIFSKKNTLDKTLYRLMRRFAALDQSSIVNENLTALINSIKGVFAASNMPDELRRKLDVYESNLYINRHEHFLKEANVFFRMTGREVFLDNEGFLSVRLDPIEVNKDEVKWFNLSKGEKTLLSLLLAAFLSRGKSTIFLLDEPDLSLHLKWQKQLLTSLCRLAPEAQFIISTHSPAMVGTIDDERILNISSFSKA
ncbi:AAA family ATPase [Pseudomonas sp. RGB]|uniref:AAA family ATPase n=1 Tax=Pseudomonas sp. RGB TaxID=2598474 RepID=UPI0015B3A202|nr:AAA family ATPase [Pseudomonas sp. RGB]